MSPIERSVFCPECRDLLQWQLDETWNRQLLYLTRAQLRSSLGATKLIESALTTALPPPELSTAAPRPNHWHCPNCRNSLEVTADYTFMCNSCGLVIAAVLQNLMQKLVSHAGRDI